MNQHPLNPQVLETLIKQIPMIDTLKDTADSAVASSGMFIISSFQFSGLISIAAKLGLNKPDIAFGPDCGPSPTNKLLMWKHELINRMLKNETYRATASEYVNQFGMPLKPSDQYAKNIAGTIYSEFGVLQTEICSLKKNHGRSIDRDTIPTICKIAEKAGIGIPQFISQESMPKITELRKKVMAWFQKNYPEVVREFVQITRNKRSNHYKNNLATDFEKQIIEIMERIEKDFGSSKKKLSTIAIIYSLLIRIEALKITAPELLSTGFEFGYAQRGYSINARTLADAMSYAENKLNLIIRIKTANGQSAKYRLPKERLIQNKPYSFAG